jgi:uncharacterized SAM-binding protein YcdF (DUF218 family)
MIQRSAIHISCLFLLALGATFFALAFRVLHTSAGSGNLPVECGLVFGAAVHRTDDPGPGIMRRTATAARLMKQGSVERLILTGGKGEVSNESEAAVMRAVAMRLGIDPDMIALEEQSTSTWENLVYSRPLVAECNSIIAISDGYHLARIRYLAELQGWGTLQTFPADNPPTGTFLTRSVLREIAAMLYYMTVVPYEFL